MKNQVKQKKIILVRSTISEAKRFIAKSHDYLVRLNKDPFAIYGCKESSAMKRASMDLTRALVDVRKPWR